MRIVSGLFKGIRIHPPKNLPVRPTTDLAKEALFNILNNNFNLEEVKVLDLFSGTGNVTYEFASRGSKNITSVELNTRCVNFIIQTVKQLKIDYVNVKRFDVFRFLEATNESYDIIFADPPYNLDRISEIADTIVSKQLLTEGGWFILEHATLQKLNHLKGFVESRIYGQSSFSIFTR